MVESYDCDSVWRAFMMQKKTIISASIVFLFSVIAVFIFYSRSFFAPQYMMRIEGFASDSKFVGKYEAGMSYHLDKFNLDIEIAPYLKPYPEALKVQNQDEIVSVDEEGAVLETQSINYADARFHSSCIGKCPEQGLYFAFTVYMNYSKKVKKIQIRKGALIVYQQDVKDRE